MDKLLIRKKILNYIDSYNNFDIEAMTELLTQNIEFKNIVGEEVNANTNGRDEFIELAKNSALIFEKRCQTMITIAVEDNIASVEIFFDGLLAKNIEGGLKKGDEIRIEGYSEFEFDENYLINKITDYSS